MTTSFCIVIPHYQHTTPLLAMLPTLAGFGLPTFIVDDASGDAIVDMLKAGIKPYAAFQVLTRAENGGKGAAMMTGLNHAAQSGYSHALSLDADGQHDMNDISRLLSLAKANPHAIITGRPVFGDDIPAARLYGRMLTNGLVKLVTASSMISDAMCGFRVYPLKTIVPLFTQLGYRTRMEFDVEILVRGCWSGLAIHSMDTKVIYPEDGSSHFNMVADNLRLVAMHTLLVLGGLIRLPHTLWRRFNRKGTI